MVLVSWGSGNGLPEFYELNEEVDEVMASELRIFIDNDGDLYRQQLTPIIKNLLRKIKSGKYDHKKAPKLWMYLVDNDTVIISSFLPILTLRLFFK